MSNWKSVAKTVATKGAVLLGTAIGGSTGGQAAQWLADAFGVSNEPDAIVKAIEANPQSAQVLLDIQLKHEAELQKIAADIQVATMANETRQLQIINDTMRAELQAPDRYRSGWRPLFGYVMAFNMAAISVAFFIAVMSVLFQPHEAKSISEAFSEMLGSFITIFSLGLGVLGIQVHKRSKDKRLAAGIKEPSIFANFVSGLRK